MTPPEHLSRPVGWWLKEADSRLDAAFDRSLAEQPVDRRGWQVLATLTRRPTPAEEVVAELSAFDPAPVVEAVLTDLTTSGWIEDVAGQLRPTEAGRRLYADLVPLVGGVREQVGAALPQQDYATLVRLLERLATALEETRRLERDAP
ncbi:MAG: hypothetical protein WB441_05435 [Nocardioidaceae bacterium]